MNVENILKELRDQKAQIELGIAAMERIAAGSSAPKRGRPPKWLSAIKNAEEPKRRGRPRKTTDAA